MVKNVLFISYDGLTDSLGQAQILPYLIGLSKKGHKIQILSCEKSENFKKNHTIVSQKCEEANIGWNYIDYDNSIPVISSFFTVQKLKSEALLTASTYFEKEFAKSSAKVVFDFDDAIWLPNVSSGNKALQLLKNPSKTEAIISSADMVFAGNDYLANYASAFCENVKVIPTTIDTTHHKREKQNTSNRVCIGWTGTETTRKYLEMIKPIFQKLTSKYGDKIYFKVICDQPWSAEGIGLKNEKWDKEKEIEQLEEIDIGVMPLTDDQWSRGKCGFKGLQYMAMESATIMSPVGVNKQIINHGENGYLASTDEDWFEQLSSLIENKELRLQIGKAGRDTVIKKYSVSSTKDLYLKYLNEIID